MQLKVSESLDSNRVRLDFKKSPFTPSRVPSYEIDKSKADEFVKKYNDQERKSVKTIQISTAIGGMVGCLSGVYKYSLKRMSIGTLIGCASGLFAGTMFTHHKKDSLIKEYGVKDVV